MPIAEIVELGHRHEVPVYPCISQSGMSRRKPYGPGTGYAVEGWRGAAATAYLSKADGVSLFNLFPAPGQEEHNRMVRQVFTEVGTPATLAGRGKLFCLDNAAHLAACGYTNHIVPYARCLPKTLPAGGELSIALPVGDDVRSARSATLRLQTDRPAHLACRLNGQPFELKASRDLNDRLGKHWTVGLVECAAVERGNNRVDIASIRPDDQPVDVTGLELLVENR